LSTLNFDEGVGPVEIVAKTIRPFVDWSLVVRQKIAPQAHFNRHLPITRLYTLMAPV
jgi:hypothetical protein